MQGSRRLGVAVRVTGEKISGRGLPFGESKPAVPTAPSNQGTSALGSKKRKTTEFLKRHPRCCFCGGGTAAATEDHVPSRATFDERQWPEGYSFPACARCNDITRVDELIVAMLARSYPDATTLEARRHSRKLIWGVANNAPGVIKSLLPTIEQKEAFLRRRGIKPPPGFDLSRLPITQVTHPDVMRALTRYAIKMVCALHYKHLARILPPDAGIWFGWRSNLQVIDGTVPTPCLS